GDRLDHGVAGANAQAAGLAQSQRALNAGGCVDVIGDITLLTHAYSSQGGDPNNDGVGDSRVLGYQGRSELRQLHRHRRRYFTPDRGLRRDLRRQTWVEVSPTSNAAQRRPSEICR